MTTGKSTFAATLADDGFIVPFQLSTSRAHKVVLPSRTLRLRLVDEQDRPMAKEPFEVLLSNGDTITGTLDERGEAKVRTPDGRGEVSFPRLADADEAK